MGTSLNMASLDQIVSTEIQTPLGTILMMPTAALPFQEDHSSVSITITGQSQWL